jgi:hypothetical protein
LRTAFENLARADAIEEPTVGRKKLSATVCGTKEKLLKKPPTETKQR